MKKFIMTFLVAGLMITSALSLSSCKKTDTNASEEEWVPTTYDLIMNDNPLTRVGNADCPYCDDDVLPCNHGVNWRNDEVCPLGPYDPVCNPTGHYHDHSFTADDDCTPPNNPEYQCFWKKVRKHRHVVVYWQGGWWNNWHLGGSVGGCD